MGNLSGDSTVRLSEIQTETLMAGLMENRLVLTLEGQMVRRWADQLVQQSES